MPVTLKYADVKRVVGRRAWRAATQRLRPLPGMKRVYLARDMEAVLGMRLGSLEALPARR